MSDNRLNTDGILFIMADTNGYDGKGFAAAGYRVCNAYKKIGTMLRLVREIWFRIPFLPQSVWYDKLDLDHKPRHIFIRDTLITRRYLVWLAKMYPKAKIHFIYCNLIGRARHIKPALIPDYIGKWTYDEGDGRVYNLNINPPLYHSNFVQKRKNKKYDLLFVGRDKGRARMLKRLEKYLKDSGFRTKFLIMPNGRLSGRKKFYHKEIPYRTISGLVAQSGAVLNVALKGQTGATVRDYEAIYNKVKLVTTNSSFLKQDICDKANTFVLTEENWDGLKDFLRREYVPGFWWDRDKCSERHFVRYIIEQDAKS